ncbi:uncharacterized protein LOC112347092 [Selaginella moellendorffii]|uniref:uncharacterized protein LOC112347092 n=1 Tax=Selaginella moellendorffii TaxID=88036 RepID=UPI000D1C79A3|nr:uncharacterized protein LOC112347092 [Selaginella moellendorffii]XP_024533187.1 uncharacterized protein LOC112347092 [Selaginella moellendorffii]XP_024533195.1 uncharacterized protein LOC112347092 [Selaginella moellendorffii]XP_024533201.1 uncharacterized protein LOC112347092 [Selaginella moellendorffii]XP_024533207.1 uncharacterized protein LOC112347092 [Selaginella moellendorffii]|eukprot:XP_024533181.1 uncharacterized protein LOC112347092 [Selaginella moellendorffii]
MFLTISIAALKLGFLGSDIHWWCRGSNFSPLLLFIFQQDSGIEQAVPAFVCDDGVVHRSQAAVREAVEEGSTLVFRSSVNRWWRGIREVLHSSSSSSSALAEEKELATIELLALLLLENPLDLERSGFFSPTPWTLAAASARTSSAWLEHANNRRKVDEAAGRKRRRRVIVRGRGAVDNSLERVRIIGCVENHRFFLRESSGEREKRDARSKNSNFFRYLATNETKTSKKNQETTSLLASTATPICHHQPDFQMQRTGKRRYRS